MAVDAANLMSQVYDYFKDLYPSTSPDAFLMFERLGLPINPADMQFNGTDFPPMAVEWVSSLANKVLVVHDGSVLHSSQTVDGVVSLMLNASRPDTADDAESLGACKREGAAKFEITLQSLSGIVNDAFHPILASPVDWFRPGPSAAWTSYTAGQTSQSTSPNPTSPSPGPTRFRPLTWQIAPETDIGKVNAPAPHISTVALPRLHMLDTLKLSADLQSASPTAAAAIPSQTQHVQRALADPALRLQLTSIAPQRLAQLQNLLATTAQNAITAGQQAVSNTNLTMNFEYCVVQLSWPWMPQTLLQLRNWYVPGYLTASISDGSGAGDTGIVPVLPSAFLAIRDLTVTANWTADDLRSVQSATALGPFSLRSSHFQQNTGTLTIPGLQIIGWFCSALPKLPPSSDSNLFGSATRSNFLADQAGSIAAVVNS